MSVKVGDRYLHGLVHITITHLDTDPVRIRYTSLNPDTKATWESRTNAIPPSWVKVGSGADPILTCVGCGIDDAEPGSIYCSECVVQYAAGWAGVRGDDAARMARTLIDEAEKERAER